MKGWNIYARPILSVIYVSWKSYDFPIDNYIQLKSCLIALYVLVLEAKKYICAIEDRPIGACICTFYYE